MEQWIYNKPNRGFFNNEYILYGDWKQCSGLFRHCGGFGYCKFNSDSYCQLNLNMRRAIGNTDRFWCYDLFLE
jgi:hypothetical protein